MYRSIFPFSDYELLASGNDIFTLVTFFAVCIFRVSLCIIEHGINDNLTTENRAEISFGILVAWVENMS